MLLRRGLSALLARAKPVLLPSDRVLPRGVQLKDEAGLQLQDAFNCSTCQEKVVDLPSLWICHSCGEYRSQGCLSSVKSSCPHCGAKNTVLNLPNRLKTERGVALVRHGSSVGMFIRLAVHAVALEGQGAFLDANKLRSAAKLQEAQQLYTYVLFRELLCVDPSFFYLFRSCRFAVKCFNWIRLSAPEYFHACGFDSDLIRAAAMRSDEAESARLVRAVPELFVNQSLLPQPVAAPPQQGGKGELRGGLGSFFVQWDQVASRLQFFLFICVFVNCSYFAQLGRE